MLKACIRLVKMKRITGKTKDATLLEMTNKADAHVEGTKNQLSNASKETKSTF